MIDLTALPDNVRKELETLSPDAILYLQQSQVDRTSDKTKFQTIVGTLEDHLESLEEDHPALIESPDTLTIAALMFACQLMLGSDNLDFLEDDLDFKSIKLTMQSINDNKFLLKLFPEIVKTKQFKNSRKKKEEPTPTPEVEAEEAFPVVEEEKPKKAAKRKTLKK